LLVQGKQDMPVEPVDYRLAEVVAELHTQRPAVVSALAGTPPRPVYLAPNIGLDKSCPAG
jgi:hypothetical protein